MQKRVQIMALAILFTPMIVFAQETIETAFSRFATLLNTIIIPLLMVAATVVFLWGLVKYITAAGSEEQVADGRRLMMWGLIALAIMVAVWGFVTIFLQFIFPTTGGIEPTPIGPQQ